MILLKERNDLKSNIDPKASQFYGKFTELVNTIRSKNLPQNSMEWLDQEIEDLNKLADNDLNLVRIILKKKNRVLKLVQQKHQLVPKNYYKKLWLILGMSAFGIPMGVAFGISIGNLGLLGIGIPIGLALGIGVGINLDNKAEKEGKQLDFEND
jgi:hypothetical protein